MYFVSIYGHKWKYASENNDNISMKNFSKLLSVTRYCKFLGHEVMRVKRTTDTTGITNFWRIPRKYIN